MSSINCSLKGTYFHTCILGVVSGLVAAYPLVHAVRRPYLIFAEVDGASQFQAGARRERPSWGAVADFAVPRSRIADDEPGVCLRTVPAFIYESIYNMMQRGQIKGICNGEAQKASEKQKRKRQMAEQTKQFRMGSSTVETSSHAQCLNCPPAYRSVVQIKDAIYLYHISSTSTHGPFT